MIYIMKRGIFVLWRRVATRRIKVLGQLPTFFASVVSNDGELHLNGAALFAI